MMNVSVAQKNFEGESVHSLPVGGGASLLTVGLTGVSGLNSRFIAIAGHTVNVSASQNNHM